MTDAEINSLEEQAWASAEGTCGRKAILLLIAELRQARKERDWVIEQIFTGWPCPVTSDETPEDCDKKISCEDCWLQAAKEATEDD